MRLLTKKKKNEALKRMLANAIIAIGKAYVDYINKKDKQ